ncbi:hypothetical protein [Hungatella sp.]|uniref:hypothetical protein n=1 Tax=Hungatella sp. TaxID=2613924 RepID=UPI003994A7FE
MPEVVVLRMQAIWYSASDIGATFGTIGMLCGIIWGMIIVNKAAESGKTTVKMKRGGASEEYAHWILSSI